MTHNETVIEFMKLKLVGREIIDTGIDWLQLDNGLKIYLSPEEVASIIG